MAGTHEGLMHGVPSDYSWAAGPEAVTSFPNDFGALMAWGQVYEDADGNPAANSRVALRNLNAWVLRRSTGTWKLVQQSTEVEGGAFRESFIGNDANDADARVEPDGSISVTAGNGRNYHFWEPGGRAEQKSSDIAGLVATVDVRLALSNERRPDDRESARYLVGVGADRRPVVSHGATPPSPPRALPAPVPDSRPRRSRRSCWPTTTAECWGDVKERDTRRQLAKNALVRDVSTWSDR